MLRWVYEEENVGLFSDGFDGVGEFGNVGAGAGYG